MPDLSPATVQQTDPILSTVAQGYRHPMHVGHFLFPDVPVDAARGKILVFGKESFKIYNTKRAPGSDTKRVRFGYEGDPFVLEDDSLDAVVPREWLRDARQVPGIDLATRAVNLVMRSIALGLENDRAQLATDANNYDAQHKVTLSGTSQWTDPGSNPEADILTGMEQVRKTTGFEPNVCLFGPDSFRAIKGNVTFKDNFKYTTDKSVDEDMIKAHFGFEVVAKAKAVKANDAGVFSDLWGDFCILAYAPQNPSGNEEPSYGYTYTLRGHPAVETPYFDPRSKSWVYGTTHEKKVVHTSLQAGYLIEDTAA